MWKYELNLLLFYHEKRVEVIYIIDNNVIITITVYVFYGKWEE